MGAGSATRVRPAEPGPAGRRMAASRTAAWALAWASACTGTSFSTGLLASRPGRVSAPPLPTSAPPPGALPPAANTAPPATPATAPPPASDFVSAQGGGFSRGGQPLTLLGLQASLPGLMYCEFTSAELDAALVAMAQKASANIVRLWFLQAAGGPGHWENFDAAVAAAKRHSLLVLPTLVNQWGDCEPLVQGQKHYKRRAWYESGYQVAGAGYPLSFRDYAVAVADHFKDEPAIAMWQLVNEAEAREPDQSCAPGTAAVIRTFADDMASRLHAAAPYHLVNLGTAAKDRSQCGTVDDDFRLLHAGAIDACEIHTYDPADTALPPYLAAQIERCRALKKPIFMGEVGICRNLQADGSCAGNASDATLARRAAGMDKKIRAGLQAGLAGHLLWQYSPTAGAFVDPTYGVGPADPILGVLDALARGP